MMGNEVKIIDMTALTLLRWNLEGRQWQENKSLLTEFEEEKLAAFFKLNGAQIEVLLKQREQLERSFFEFDEVTGKVKMHQGPAIVNLGGKAQPSQPKPMMKKGETIETYRKALEDFHNQLVPYKKYGPPTGFWARLAFLLGRT